MLKLTYYGQNDGLHGPDVTLTGDPGTDNATLQSAGYVGGTVVALKTSATAGRGVVLVPCDAAASQTPYGFLLNGPGEFASALTPSVSKKMSVVRAMAEFLVSSEAYVATPTTPYAVGAPLYCGTGANKGKLTADQPTAGAGVFTEPIGTITSIPTASSPWLGVASLL